MAGVKRLRLIGSGALLLLLLAACFCGGPDEPARADCNDPVPGATVDGLELNAFSMVGGQGSAMLMLNLTYLGADVPECAEIRVRVLSPEGVQLRDVSQGVVTNEVVGGRALREAWWTFWEFEEQVEVIVEAYGQTASQRVCRGACQDAGPETPDAGEVDAGGLDAGEVDAGGLDAGDVDAGEVDAGEVDAGEVDAGEADAG